MADFSDFNAKLDGRKLKRHAVLTCAGTWGVPGTQYPSNTVDGLNEYVDSGLAFNVPVQYPTSFGPLPPGAIDAPSYKESVAIGEQFIVDWLHNNPDHTFAIAGYSQGAEVASNILDRLMSYDLQPFKHNFIGGYTFGNPRRPADQDSRGIASNQLDKLPADGVWKDFFHAKKHGDPADDMYACVPLGVVGYDMSYVYDVATHLQLRDPLDFFGYFLGSLNDAAGLLFGSPTYQERTNQSKVNDLVSGSIGLLSGDFSDAGKVVSGLDVLWNPVDVENKTGLDAAFEAAMRGLAFLTAPGGPTAPHISYLGEIPGYSNLVEHAVWHLYDICNRVPARDGSE